MGVRSFVMGIFDWVYEEPQLRVETCLMNFENRWSKVRTSVVRYVVSDISLGKDI
jgi:hypothetical protein